MFRSIGILLLLSMTLTDSKSQAPPSTLRTFALRMPPHADIKKSIMEFARTNKIKAGCILSAVGSVEQAHIRFADRPTGTFIKERAEVVSLSGTFSEASCHIHISISDGGGNTKGGHLLDENLVYTTLELVIGELKNYEFVRERDDTYGYDELVVKPSKSHEP
jgi:predicted DNA-binding protein with PD1-like motif